MPICLPVATDIIKLEVFDYDAASHDDLICTN